MLTAPVKPPSIKGLPLLGVLGDFRKDPPGFLLEASRQHGDVVHFRFNV